MWLFILFLLVVANSHSFVFNAFLIPFHSFLSFVSFGFFFPTFEPDHRNQHSRRYFIAKGEPKITTIISRKHSNPLKWIECDHWLLYWIYFTLKVFTENLSTSFRFVLLCFGSVKLSRPSQFAYIIYFQPNEYRSMDLWWTATYIH